MSVILGVQGALPWTKLIRRPPTHVILAYVHDRWQAFADECTADGRSLQDWKETNLTQALHSKLAKAHSHDEQPFDGDFLAETQRFDLDLTTGKPFCVSRTDIEYLLTGLPRFIIEFKILDGSTGYRTKYWREGVLRFASSTYAPAANEAAMWGFLRSAGHGDGDEVSRLLVNNAGRLKCDMHPGTPRRVPSKLAGSIGSFDSVHLREGGRLPIEIAHIFVRLPTV
jgi:hypothetical protein